MWLPAAASAQGDGGAPANPSDARAVDGDVSLPVTRIILTTAGVGTFVHEGFVDGDARWTLRVPEGDMDDVLQTLVVEDLSGGTVSDVRYDVRDPLERILASYPFDVASASGLADLLDQARGAVVRLDGAEPVTGTLVAVEETRDADGRASWTLVVVDGTRIVRVGLDRVAAVEFVDPSLQADLMAALAAMASDRGGQDTVVTVLFEGEGRRDVRVSYVRDMPAWKTTYRLVPAGDGVVDLQAWAILDNPTSVDLNDVHVTFLAGSPVAFVTELYDPVYVTRARVAPPVAPSIVPDADAGAFEPLAPPLAMARSMAADAVASPAPGAVESTPALSGAGVDAVATQRGDTVATAFQVSEPISVGRYQSALVPIVTARLDATVVTHAAPARSDGLPMRAVMLRNPTDALLPAGTVTAYGAYGFDGNALLDDVPAGAERTVRFARDLGVRVAVADTVQPEVVTFVRLSGGVLETDVRTRLRSTFEVTALDDDDRLVVVEWPAPRGFAWIGEGAEPERAEDTWRVTFAVGSDASLQGPAERRVDVACVEAQGPCRFETVVERVDRRSFRLVDASNDRLAVFLEGGDLSADARRWIERLVDARQELSRLTSSERVIAERIDAIAGDQARIRENLAVLEAGSSLYLRYLTDLEQSEDALAEAREERIRLQSRIEEAQRDLQDVVRQLP